MIRILKKSEQFKDVIFSGKFIVNKPVSNDAGKNVEPYSNLFYWSHSVAIGDCEFDLHPHEGFEIMTFILEGNISHYDTETQVWTPLETGDFQVIQSNSGLQHCEKISKGARAFQIWFDPNYYETLKMKPAYTDYHSKDFQPQIVNGIKTIVYIGNESNAKVLTPNLKIARLFFDNQTKTTFELDSNSSYTFYVLSGKGLMDSQSLKKDDALRISNANQINIDFHGELFYIQTPETPDYTVIWK